MSILTRINIKSWFDNEVGSNLDLEGDEFRDKLKDFADSVPFKGVDDGLREHVDTENYPKFYCVVHLGIIQQSKINNNIGAFNQANWLPVLGDTVLALFGSYDDISTFILDAIISFEGSLYKSKIGGNQGNQPDVSPTEWLAVTASINRFGQKWIDAVYVRDQIIADPVSGNLYRMKANPHFHSVDLAAELITGEWELWRDYTHGKVKVDGSDPTEDYWDQKVDAASDVDAVVSGSKFLVTIKAAISALFNTSNQKDALDAATAPATGNPFVTQSVLDSTTSALLNAKHPKQGCKTVATSNITLSGHQTLEGYLTTDDDRVVVENNTDKTKNGIWDAKPGAWVRSDDFDEDAEVSDGAFTRISEGNKVGWSYMVINSGDPVDVGTDDITWDSTADIELGTGAGQALPGDSALIGDATKIMGRTVNAALSTKGDIYTDDGTKLIKLPAGSNNKILVADSAQASGLKYAHLNVNGGDMTGQYNAQTVSKVQGKTIAAMAAKGDIWYYDSVAGDIKKLTLGTNGQVLTVDTALNGGVKWEDAAGAALADLEEHLIATHLAVNLKTTQNLTIITTGDMVAGKKYYITRVVGIITAYDTVTAPVSLQIENSNGDDLQPSIGPRYAEQAGAIFNTRVQGGTIGVDQIPEPKSSGYDIRVAITGATATSYSADLYFYGMYIDE